MPLIVVAPEASVIEPFQRRRSRALGGPKNVSARPARSGPPRGEFRFGQVKADLAAGSKSCQAAAPGMGNAGRNGVDLDHARLGWLKLLRGQRPTSSAASWAPPPSRRFAPGGRAEPRMAATS